MDAQSPREAARREGQRYQRVIRVGAALYLVTQMAATKFGFHFGDAHEAMHAKMVLALLLCGSGIFVGLASALVDLQQRLVTGRSICCFEVPWASTISRAYFLSPVANAVALMMIGGALSYAMTRETLEPWRGALVVAPSVLWVGAFATYSSVVSLRIFSQRVREALDAERLARELHARAELTALRAQINPHFLFNALNTVAHLIDEAPERAERTVEQLSAVFRHTLARSASAFAPLSEELAFLRAYLDVERERFGERLAIEWDVDSEAEVCFVPTMLLQPLVENALKHAVAPRRAGGMVRISIHKSGRRLSCEVRDFGGPTPVLALEDMLGRGTGLSNVQERLIGLFGDASSVRLERPAGGGAAFRFEVPVLGASDVGEPLCVS